MYKQLLILTAGFLLGSLPLLAQQRPLQVDDPKILPSGLIRLQTGFEFFQNQKFSLSGLQGDLKRIGALGYFVGVGPAVEFQVSGALWNKLIIEKRFPAFNSEKLNFTGNSTGSIGDFMLAAKFRLIKESPSTPAISFRFGVELPNASEKKGLSNNQTNFYAWILTAKSFGKFRAIGNLGLAILDNPTSLSAQKDLFTFGAAGIYEAKRHLSLLAEITGRAGPGGAGTDEQCQMRAGARLDFGILRLDLAGMTGLAKQDPKAGLIFGITHEFKPFR
jgi:hypothetical protein